MSSKNSSETLKDDGLSTSQDNQTKSSDTTECSDISKYIAKLALNTTNRPPPSLLTLPNELLVKIFQWLHYADLHSISLLSVRFAQILPLIAKQKTCIIVHQHLIMPRLVASMKRNLTQAQSSSTAPENILNFTDYCTLSQGSFARTNAFYICSLRKQYKNIVKQYSHLSKVIFSQYVFHFNGEVIRLMISELLNQLPALIDVQIVSATYPTSLTALLFNCYDELSQAKLDQLQHLTFYSKAINNYNGRNHELTTVFSNLIELNIAGFTGGQMNYFLSLYLQQSFPRLQKLGLRQQHLETVLEQLQLVEPVVAARITHLTIKTFTDENPLLAEEAMNQLADKFGVLEVVNDVAVVRRG